MSKFAKLKWNFSSFQLNLNSKYILLNYLYTVCVSVSTMWRNLKGLLQLSVHDVFWLSKMYNYKRLEKRKLTKELKVAKEHHISTDTLQTFCFSISCNNRSPLYEQNVLTCSIFNSTNQKWCYCLSLVTSLLSFYCAIAIRLRGKKLKLCVFW